MESSFGDIGSKIADQKNKHEKRVSDLDSKSQMALEHFSKKKEAIKKHLAEIDQTIDFFNNTDSFGEWKIVKQRSYVQKDIVEYKELLLQKLEKIEQDSKAFEGDIIKEKSEFEDKIDEENRLKTQN